MSEKLRTGNAFKFLVIGAGKRVVQDVLPVLESMGNRVELRGVYSSTPKRIELERTQLITSGAADLNPDDFDEINGIYVCVPPDQVHSVLRRITRFDVSQIDLVVDTPIDSNLHEFRLFRSVTVAEDSGFLPWLPLFRKALSGEGGASQVVFYRSAYAYHAVSLFRALVSEGVASSDSARLSRWSFGPFKFVELGDTRLVMIEPRSYSKGSILVRSRSGRTFSSHRRFGATPLTLRIRDNFCIGFELGDCASELTAEESKLVGNVLETDTVVSKMLKFKRVGLRHLMERVVEGAATYSVDSAINDFETSSKAVSPQPS